MNNNTLVKISKVSFTYNEERVLDDINLEIKRGDFLGLIGPNGSGKTTLLKIILGLLKLQKGNISLFDQDIQSFNQWKKIGYVPQKAAAFISQFPITVEEVVSMGGAHKESVKVALAAVSMQNYNKKLISQLSGGQQQRVFIARALASKPELLILDEPTVGVDVDSQAKFYQLLRDLNKNLNLTLVLVSHDIDVVAHEVSTLACINSKLICHGNPKDIITSDFMKKIYGKDLRFVIHAH